MSDIVEAWLWRPPGDIIERLMARSERCGRRGEALLTREPDHQPHDRYYTQARRLRVKQAMKGKA